MRNLFKTKIILIIAIIAVVMVFLLNKYCSVSSSVKKRNLYILFDVDAYGTLSYLDSILFDQNLYSTGVKQYSEKDTILNNLIIGHDFTADISCAVVNGNYLIERAVKFGDSIVNTSQESVYYGYNSFEYFKNINNNYEFYYINISQKSDRYKEILPKAIYLIWGPYHNINSKTKYIKTNLPEYIIHKLYPDFKGKYIYDYYRYITFNRNFRLASTKFFEYITFEK